MKELLIARNYNIARGSLGSYYFDFSRVLNPSWPLDENGVRLRPYPPPLFNQYNPIAIGEFALDNHRMYIVTGNSLYRDNFLNNAKWFIENVHLKDKCIGLWYFHFKLSHRYNMSYPYASSMSQGYAISVLLRAYELTGEHKYIDTALQALNSFTLDVKDGGIRNMYKGYVFYEEAPSIPPSCILNGFIFGLLGVYDFFRLHQDEQSYSIFKQGIETLENCISMYDLGYWSLYNLQYDKYLASKYYHNIHIKQLTVLNHITNKGIFEKFASKWEKFTTNRKCINKYYVEFYRTRVRYKMQRLMHFFSSF